MTRRSHGHRRFSLRPSSAVGVLALLAVLLAGCSGSGLGGSEAARVLAGGGLLVADGGDWAPAEIGDHVPDGARVRTDQEEVRLELRAGEVWLAPGSAAIVTNDRVDLIRGDLLVASGGSLTARWAEVDVSGPGVYRLTPGYSPRLAVYRGDVILSRPGERVIVSALRQADLSVRRLAAVGAPLAYRDDDAWDAELLAPAIAFDSEVSRFSRGVDREFGTGPQEPAFYRGFAAVDVVAVPVLARASRVTSDGRFGPPSETLVTLFIAQAAARSSDRQDVAVVDVAQRVGRLRSLGARWGLVATELGVTTTAFLAAADLSPAGSLAEARELIAGLPGATRSSLVGGSAAPAPAASGANEDPDAPVSDDRPAAAAQPQPQLQPPPGRNPQPERPPQEQPPVDEGKIITPTMLPVPLPPLPPLPPEVESTIDQLDVVVTDVIEGVLDIVP